MTSAEARDPIAAEAMLRAAVTRLALLALPQQARYWSKRVADDRELTLTGGALGLERPVAELLVERIFAECFAPAEQPAPRSGPLFERQLEQGRLRLEEQGERVMAVVRAVCAEWRALRTALGALRGSAPVAAADIDTQLAQLLGPRFLTATPNPWFAHLPRYLKAAVRRAARLPAEVRRDAQLSARVAPFVSAWRALQSERPVDSPRPQLEQLRWMIEEFRVSLYAQELRTVMPVSERRLAEQLDRATAETRAQLAV